MNGSVIYCSGKTPCLGKMCFLSYTVSYSDCTIFRLSRSLQGIKRYLRFFLHENNHQAKLALETSFFGWVWPVVLLIQSCSKIFYHQYFWKELIYLLGFLVGDNHQRKVASETSTFGWVWSGVPLGQSDSWILWSSISLEGKTWQLCLTIVNLFYLFCCIFIKYSRDPFSYNMLWLIFIISHYHTSTLNNVSWIPPETSDSLFFEAKTICILFHYYKIRKYDPLYCRVTIMGRLSIVNE